MNCSRNQRSTATDPRIFVAVTLLFILACAVLTSIVPVEEIRSFLGVVSTTPIP